MSPQESARRPGVWYADGRNSMAHEAGELWDLEFILRVNWSL